MNILWTNTSNALQDFASILVCGKCRSKPISPVRLTNCGHFFCHNCIRNATKCITCDVPVQPREISSDHLISNLIQNCDHVAEIIRKRDLWDNAENISNVSLDNTSIINTSRNQFNIRKRNIDKPNPKGETPLHVACLKNNPDQVKQLLLAGANANTKDNAGWTPLQEMISFGRTEICELLLDCGASPNISGYKNRRPLHEAVKCNRIEEIKLLLRHQADTELCDKSGRKPMDYCKSDEIRQLLMDAPQQKVFDLNQTLDKSSTLSRCNKFVILSSNLKHENHRLLCLIAAKHKFKILTTYRPSVTHVVVEVNEQNITKLTLDVLFTIVRGDWLLNSAWIQVAEVMDDISDMDLELYEVNGVPTSGIPKKARENTECRNPRLFNNCFFYFALQANATYQISDIRLTKDDLVRLVKEGEGTVLTREPDPEDLKLVSQVVPFHTANDKTHLLHKCTHYVIYMPGKNEPRIKYKMPHIKSLPLMWLIECIEKFTLVNPAHLGLS